MADPATLGMMVDPSDYAAAQRNQQLAQILTQMSMTPEQPQAVSGGKYTVAPRMSPLAIPTKLLQALMAKKTAQSGIEAQQRYAQTLMNSGSGLLGTATGQTGNPQDYGTRMQALNRAVQFGLVDPKVGEQIGSQIGAENKPAELDAALRGAGIMPNTPEYQNVMAAAAKKGIYIAPAEVRQGNVALDANNKPIMQNPQREFVPDPFNPGTGHWNTAPAVPGVPLPGQPPAAASVPGAPPAPTAPAAPKTYFQQPPASPQPPMGRTAADLEAQKKGAESGQSYADQLVKNAENATEVRRSLAELKNLSASGGVAVSNPAKLQLGGMMIAMGMDPDRVGKMLGTDVGALTAASKQTGSLAVDSIHSMTGRGTNFDLETFMRYNPNLNMASPDGFKRVVQFIDQRMQEEVAKQKDFDSWSQHQPPNRWASGHTVHWLEQQNQKIDKGETNSSAPTATPKPVSQKTIGGKTYYSDGKNWFDNPGLK